MKINFFSIRTFFLRTRSSSNKLSFETLFIEIGWEVFEIFHRQYYLGSGCAKKRFFATKRKILGALQNNLHAFSASANINTDHKMYMEFFFLYYKYQQVGRAIQYTSEVVNDTDLKYKKISYNLFRLGGHQPPRLDRCPRPRVSTDAKSQKPINKCNIYKKNLQFCKSTSPSKSLRMSHLPYKKH